MSEATSSFFRGYWGSQPSLLLAQPTLLPTESFPQPVFYDTDPLTGTGQLFRELSLTLEFV